MNQKWFANTVLIVFVVVLAGTVGYLAFNQKNSVPVPVPSSTLSLTPTSTFSPTPSSTPMSGSKDNIVSASLGKQFTLKKGQVSKIADTGLEVEIMEFFNSPCPTGVECFWSGVGIMFEYRLNGQVKTGMNLVQAFGYQITIVKTDNETYANLVVKKMK